MMINKDSLTNRVKHLSEIKGVPSNVILQNYFFDAFLKRLSKSKYSKKFIFKGGFLLSTKLGIDFRSTMDIDFLLKNISLSKENVVTMIKEITSIKIDDEIIFTFKGIQKIKQEDKYGGYSVSLLGTLENIRVTVNIDIATGDPMTPDAIIYDYHCMFDNEVLHFASYNYETIVAEKLETILTRGLGNSRSKDFYDLFIIYKLRWEEINKNTLKKAFYNTCSYRQSNFTKDDAFVIINDIHNNKIVVSRWELYKKKNKYVGDVLFDSVIDSITKIIIDIL